MWRAAISTGTLFGPKTNTVSGCARRIRLSGREAGISPSWLPSRGEGRAGEKVPGPTASVYAARIGWFSELELLEQGYAAVALPLDFFGTSGLVGCSTEWHIIPKLAC